MNTKELLYKKLNALRLEVDSSIVDDIKSTVDDLFSQQNGAKPIVSGSLPQVDWVIMRQKYFSDCVVKDSVDGLKLRIDYAPHDLFEWFKKEIQLGGNDR